jgi:hypothetical protein
MDEVARAPLVDDRRRRPCDQEVDAVSPAPISGESLLAPPALSTERARLRALAAEENNGAARNHYRAAWRRIMERVGSDETLRALLTELDEAVVDLVVEGQDQVLDRVVIGILLDEGTPNLVDLRTTRRTRLSPKTCSHEECDEALDWASVARRRREDESAASSRSRAPLRRQP